jgi:broad specificity phosphatase PhoE
VRIILIRHGQTTWNLESRYQGHSDSMLSGLGRMQAKRLAERLKDERVDAVYSSDLRRASETAEAIADAHKLPVHTDPRLREVAFGIWEGLTVAEIKAAYPEFFARYRVAPVVNRPEGAEQLESMQERAVAAVEEIAQRHPGGTAVVVAHGGPIRAFFCHAFDADLSTFRKIGLDNGSITTFRLLDDGRWLLEVLNDTSHLCGLKLPSDTHDETASDEA